MRETKRQAITGRDVMQPANGMWKQEADDVDWSLEICFTFTFQCQPISLLTLTSKLLNFRLVYLIYVIKKLYSVLEYSIER